MNTRRICQRAVLSRQNKKRLSYDKQGKDKGISNFSATETGDLPAKSLRAVEARRKGTGKSGWMWFSGPLNRFLSFRRLFSIFIHIFPHFTLIHHDDGLSGVFPSVAPCLQLVELVIDWNVGRVSQTTGEELLTSWWGDGRWECLKVIEILIHDDEADAESFF